jgi:hypothetical protein
MVSRNLSANPTSCRESSMNQLTYNAHLSNVRGRKPI